MLAIKCRLKEMMQMHKLSAPKLAARSGVPLGSIKSILNGQSQNPRATTLEALAKAFDCQIAQLLSENTIIDPANTATTRVAVEDFLFKAAIAKVEEITKNKGVSLEGRDEIKRRCVTKIYQYAMEKLDNQNSEPKIDNIYAQWVVDRELEG